MICRKNKTIVVPNINCILIRAVQRAGPAGDQLSNGPGRAQIG